MQPILQHLIQRGVNSAVAVEAGFAGERGRYDAHAEVGFAAAIKRTTIAVMVAGVQVAFVDNFQTVWREGLAQFLFGNKSSVH